MSKLFKIKNEFFSSTLNVPAAIPVVEKNKGFLLAFKKEDIILLLCTDNQFGYYKCLHKNRIIFIPPSTLEEI